MDRGNSIAVRQSAKPLPIPQDFIPTTPPDSVTNQSDLQPWHRLFKARLDWALAIVERCRSMADDTQRHQDAREVIHAGLRAASGNHDSHIRSLARKLDNAKTWADDILRKHNDDIERWEANLQRLAGVPALEPVLGLVRPAKARREHDGDEANANTRVREGFRLAASTAGDEVTLRALIGFDDVRAAAMDAKSLSSKLGQIISELSNSVDSIISDHNSLLDALDNSPHKNESKSQEDEFEEPSKLLEEMLILIKKISSDFEHVATLPESPKSASQVSKLALLHTRNYLPSLLQYAREMSDLQRISVEQRNQTQAQAVKQHMPAISSIESRLSGTTLELDNLSIPPDAADALDTLSLVSRLPYIYGSVLIEVVRRQEWTDKLKNDTSILAEELAGYRSEEDRRRRKWLRSMHDVVAANYFERSARALGVEINMQHDDNEIAIETGKQVFIPRITRADLYAYVNVLARIRGLEAAAEQLGNMVRDLDRSTKQQAKHVKAFKMGSVHETGLGRRSVLMMRGGADDARSEGNNYGGIKNDDQMKSLKTTNAKLEDELKSQKSRVRKLEDLLHRQSQLSNNASVGNSNSRPPSGTFVTPQTMPSALQTAQSAAIPISNIPQTGSEATPTERTFSPAPARPSHELSRNSPVSSRRYSSNATTNPVTDERVLTAKILKLEAELHEERGHRSALERQAAESAAATETAHDELHQQIAEANSTKKDIMENMEAQQKEFADERKMLEEELARHKTRVEELEDELEGMIGSKNGYGNESRVRDLEGEISRMREEAYTAEAELDDTRRNLLGNIFENLLFDRTTGKSELTDRVFNTNDTLDGLLTLVQERTEHVRQRIMELGMEKRTLKEKEESHKSELAAKTFEVASLNETIRSQEDKLKLQSTSLDEERDTISSLRQQLTTAEARMVRVTSELKDSQSHVNSLDVELSSLQIRSERLQIKANGSTARAKKNIKRVKNLADRLGWQGERLLGLVEGLGFVVMYGENGELNVQRASKVAGLERSGVIGGGVAVAASNNQNKNANLNSSVVSLRASTDMLGKTDSRERATVANNVDNENDASAIGTNHGDGGEVKDNRDDDDDDDDDAKYAAYLGTLPLNPNNPSHLNILCDVITKRTRDIEHTARKWQKEARAYRDRSYRLHTDAHYNKIAFRGFREGDLALFLPTRNHQQMAAVARTKSNAANPAATTTPWAAFNSGAPHYFLRERDGHRLTGREYLVGRIVRIEERFVDLGASGQTNQVAKLEPRDISKNRGTEKDRSKDAAALVSYPSTGGALDDADHMRDEFYASSNPFDLSDGLRWFLVDAVEEKPGAPSTPGLGKSTVASAHVDAKGTSSIRRAKNLSFGGSASGTGFMGGNNGGTGGASISIGGIIGSGISGIVGNAGGGLGEASRTLNKSLESRRSSSGSKVGSIGGNSNAGSGSNMGGNRSGNEGVAVAEFTTRVAQSEGAGKNVQSNDLNAPATTTTFSPLNDNHHPHATSHLSITRNANEEDGEDYDGTLEEEQEQQQQKKKDEEQAHQSDEVRRTQLPGP